MVERVTGKELQDARRGARQDRRQGDGRHPDISFGKLDPTSTRSTVNVTGLVDRVFRDHGKVWVEDRAPVFTLSRPGDEFERRTTGQGHRPAWKVLAEARNAQA